MKRSILKMPNRKGTETVSHIERDKVKCTDKDCKNSHSINIWEVNEDIHLGEDKEHIYNDLSVKEVKKNKLRAV